MMKTQNITLSISKELLRKVKLLAVKRNTSLSKLLSHTLEEIVVREEGYQLASQRSMERLAKGQDLGTQGEIPWGREELHER
jgi:hypothetical protein